MTKPAPSQTPPPAGGGLPYAIAAYLAWGFMPLYLHAMRGVPPLEFTGWRVCFTVPACLIIAMARGSLGNLISVLTNPRLLGLLATSGLMLGCNWLIFVVAAQAGHIFAISLGYYINPLLNVVLGTVFLGERLGRWQWVAVGLSAFGVSLLALSGGDRETLTMLTIALLLSLSFAAYGLVRKLTPVTALTGLTIEMLVLTAPAIGILLFSAHSPMGLMIGQNTYTTLLVASAGIVTPIPLLLFGTATRRLSLSTLGFVQFLSPTIAFVTGLFLFHQGLRPVQLACFVMIWIAIAVFSWDMFARRRG